MLGDKLCKSAITATAMLLLFSSACWSQRKVDTVHISQAKSQDLDESWAGPAHDRNSSAGNGPALNKSKGNNNNSNSVGGLSGRGRTFNRSGAGNQCCDDNRTGNAGICGGMKGDGHKQSTQGRGSLPGSAINSGKSVIGSCGGDCSGCASKCGGSCGNHLCGCPSHNSNNNQTEDLGDQGGSGLASPQTNQREAMQEFCDPGALGSLDKSWPGGNTAHQNGVQGPEVSNKQNPEQISGQTWPHNLPGFTAHFAPAGQATYRNMPKSLTQGAAAMTPPSASELVTMMTLQQSAMVESLFHPNSWLQTAKEVQNTQTQANADNSANMEKQQAGCAIDFVRSALENFTVDANNQWNKLRNELFMPMAVLLLIPGAVATQAKATVAQGFSIFGEISPIEGISRSIISIFLIPGTYLIVNYGIDVSNSIAYTIQSEYFQIFGSDMYRDAMCAHIRAFGSRLPSENKGYIPRESGKLEEQGKSPRAKFESRNVDVKLEDPCAGIYQAPESKANEKVPYAVNAQRAAYNGMGASLATTWNILCAFQMCYLYYLWFVGPIMAALWVWPVKQLRDAFSSWCEGVITICFWSLFWNTSVLLMACFRGIDDTGTVIMNALLWLCVAAVKFAFDFSGLVAAARSEIEKIAQKASQAAKSSRPKGDAHKKIETESQPGPDHNFLAHSEAKERSNDTETEHGGKMGDLGDANENISRLGKVNEAKTGSNELAEELQSYPLARLGKIESTPPPHFVLGPLAAELEQLAAPIIAPWSAGAAAVLDSLGSELAFSPVSAAGELNSADAQAKAESKPTDLINLPDYINLHSVEAAIKHLGQNAYGDLPVPDSKETGKIGTSDHKNEGIAIMESGFTGGSKNADAMLANLLHINWQGSLNPLSAEGIFHPQAITSKTDSANTSILSNNNNLDSLASVGGGLKLDWRSDLVPTLAIPSEYQEIPTVQELAIQSVDSEAKPLSLQQANIIDVISGSAADVPTGATADSGCGAAIYIERNSIEASAAVAAGALELPIAIKASNCVQPASDSPEAYRAKSQAAEPSRPVINQNQKYFDHMRIYHARSTQAPPRSAKQILAGQREWQGQEYQRTSTPARQAQEPIEIQRRADLPLADQVRYGSILRRGRGSTQINKTELLNKLSYSEHVQPSSNPL